MKSVFFAIILWCLPTAVQAQQIEMKLSFKHIDCGVRRGFSCKQVAISTPERAAFSYNSMYILGKNVVILRIFRERITEADEIQLFGRRITKRNQKELHFVLTEAEEIDAEIVQFIDKDIKELFPVLKPKSYLTMITKNHIDITLIDQRE